MEKPTKLSIVEFDASPDRYPFFRSQVEEARHNTLPFGHEDSCIPENKS